MGKKRKTRPTTKRNPEVEAEESEEHKQKPHSFVIHRGLPCPHIMNITMDIRRVMEPYTASSLKERKTNRIKDFVSLSGIFHVSHLCIFNKTTNQLSFKVIRLPRGPTLTFKVHQFTLAKDVIASTKRQFVEEEMFHNSPLVIMNNFAGEGKHLKLMAATFQNMFPTINLATVKLSTLRRCVLFSYNPVTKLIDMRHYAIIVVPVGLTRGIKKVCLSKIPNMSRCEDISDFVVHSGAASDSEFEDDEASQVILPQSLKRKGNLENNRSSVRLFEIGPRLTMELYKIEEGLLTGEVLYHKEIVRTEKEVEELRLLREKKRKLKEKRKKIQMENKKRKDDEAAKKKPRSYWREKNAEKDDNADNVDNVDNDAEYYREEVGEEPDEELFKPANNDSRKRVRIPKPMHAKRRKLSGDKDQKKKSNKFGNRSTDQKKSVKHFRKGPMDKRKKTFVKNKVKR